MHELSVDLRHIAGILGDPGDCELQVGSSLGVHVNGLRLLHQPKPIYQAISDWSMLSHNNLHGETDSLRLIRKSQN